MIAYMSSHKESLTGWQRWIVMPLLALTLGGLICFSAREVYRSLKARLFWQPTPAIITDIKRMNKGFQDTYTYFFQNQTFRGKTWEKGIFYFSKPGENITIFVNPQNPSESLVPSYIPWILFIIAALAAEAGTVSTILFSSPRLNLPFRTRPKARPRQ